jgi:hypothetical protein
MSTGHRRTRAEVQQLVAEFVDRHLKKLCWKRRHLLVGSFGPGGVGGQETVEAAPNRVVGWPWCFRVDAGSKYILTLIPIRSNAWWESWIGPKACLGWVQPLRFYPAAGVTEMRKGFEGLYSLVGVGVKAYR